MTLEQPVLPRIASGDVNAVEECLDRYGGLVWSLTRRYCADVQLAEDSVQNIFLHLWEVADRFDENIASETTFIAMIARRRLIDWQRKQKRNSDLTDCDFDTLYNEGPDPSRRLEVCEEAARAEALLCQLPDDQQHVIRLNIFEGLSHAIISNQTGLKLGTVKTYIRRGLIQIREALFFDSIDDKKLNDKKLNDTKLNEEVLKGELSKGNLPNEKRATTWRRIKNESLFDGSEDRRSNRVSSLH